MAAIDYRVHTVLITGASSGLGAEFARQLAARGAAVVLVARRTSLLEQLSEELHARYGTEVTVVSADLGAPGAGRRLREDLTGRGIRVTGLVNNAGFGTHGRFEDEDPDRLAQLVSVNVAAVVDLTQAYFADLRGTGGVLINVASILGYAPTPFMAVYGASKAFVRNFTESLWDEARGSGLRVLSVNPGPLATEFFDAAGSDRADFGIRRTGADVVVRKALAQIDRGARHPSVVTNGPPLAVVTRLLSRRTVARLMGLSGRRSLAA